MTTTPNTRVRPVRPAKTDALQPDLIMVSRFLKALTSGEDDSATFQFVDDKKENSQLAEVIHLEFNNENLSFLQKKQKLGCAVYVMVNRGDGKGRSKNNVVKIRALFIDLDGAPWKPAAELLKPHIRVETSPGHYHLYWLVSDCTLDQFSPIQQAIAKKFNGDKSCVDLPRVLRVPGTYHLKTVTPYMSKLEELNEFPEYTTKAIIDGLELDILPDPKKGMRPQSTNVVGAPNASKCEPFEYVDHSTGEVIDLAAWAMKNPSFDIIAAIDPQYFRGSPKDGKQHIVCPFESVHTDKAPDFAAFIANASPPQYKSWDIHCCHAHCVDRDRLEYLSAFLVKGWLSVNSLQTVTATQTSIEMKRPRFVSYPVNDILAAPEWSTLLAEERRIALDLMTMAWASDDGTIQDDDWLISRRLDISENKWLDYRKTLIRAGWLIEYNGKLTNRIVKQEFDAAQLAYMSVIVKAGNGGRRTQERARLKRMLEPPLGVAA